MRITVLLKIIFFFFGTFLHELAHYLSAAFFGKAGGFSVVPKIEGDRLIFGSVTSRTKFKVLSSFIALAPLVWWVALLLIAMHFQLIKVSDRGPEINLDPAFNKIRTFCRWDFFYVWLYIQMGWAGTLSSADIKNFFGGFLSASGIVLLSTAAIIVFLMRNFLLR